MSYIVSVQRDVPITGDESADVFELKWQPDKEAEPVSFVLNDGTIDVSTPSDSALRKMQSLAKLLDAIVVGEEDEELTTTEIVDVPSQGCGPMVWTVALIVAFVSEYWILN